MNINDDMVCMIHSNVQEWQQSVQALWTGKIWKDDWSDYSNDLHECIGDSHVYVMASQCDTNLCAQINSLNSSLLSKKYSISGCPKYDFFLSF